MIAAVDAPSPPPPRLTMRAVGAQLVDEFASLDRGWPFTLGQLLRRPGHALRRYVEWRDPRYTKPLRYFVVALALAGLLVADFGAGFVRGFAQGFADAGPAVAATAGGLRAPSLLVSLFAFLARGEILVPLALVPTLAAALQHAFPDEVNLAESFAISAYVSAQALLLFAAIATFGRYAPITQAAIALAMLAFVAWPLVMLRAYFARAPWTRVLLAWTLALLAALLTAGMLLSARYLTRGA